MGDAGTSGRPESVVLGRDRDVIPMLLAVHAMPNPVILDACHNRGVMWKGSGYEPHKKLDLEPLTLDTDRGDFTAMPYDDETFDVVAFDPPHLVNDTGRAGVHLGVGRYGLDKVNGCGGYSIEPLFDPFLAEASRVLRPNGIVIAKIADQVHNHRYQWQHVDFVVAARARGLTPCDVIVKRDPSSGTLTDPKWRNVRHFRRAHCFWIVVRKGRCERPLAAVTIGDTGVLGDSHARVGQEGAG